MKYIVFCFVWFFGMFIRFLGKEMFLFGDLDIRIDIFKREYIVCNKSGFCVEKIKL